MEKESFILIACAMKREAQLLINELEESEEVIENTYKFCIGKIY